MNAENENIRYYLHMDELFPELLAVHQKIGHGGRDRMLSEIKRQYKNVSRAIVMDFLGGCEHCEKKRSNKRKGIVVKPMVFSHMNSRGQIDLIDLQSCPDGDCKFICVYQDHLTKFVMLKALTSKRAEAVTFTLLDIFTIFGAPCILQSDNGREFCNAVITSLKEMWPACKIVHGKPRHSQSQGSVERANRDIEEMIFTWKSDNKTTKWSEGLRFIQFMKNRALHDGIKQSPYEAMFGVPATVGLETTSLPKEIWDHIDSEEDVEEAMAELQSTTPSDDLSQSSESEEDAQEDISEVHAGTPSEALSPDQDQSQESHSPEATPALNDDSRTVLDERKDAILRKRTAARDSLMHQAKKMKRQSNAKFPDPPIGATVRIPLSDVDRGKTDAR